MMKRKQKRNENNDIICLICCIVLLLYIPRAYSLHGWGMVASCLIGAIVCLILHLKK